MYETLRTAFGTLYADLHENLRAQVRGLDDGTLNWRPLPKANSVAVLVTHTLGSELEMMRSVRTMPTQRDRDSEFRAEAGAERLLEMIDAADREMSELIAAATEADLTELRPRGDRPPRPGIHWMISNYGHAREHLAQIELTKQLYDSRT
jgi:DinB superfamily